MEPYVQQHPMYAASPYTQHLVYVPQAMHPQQAQYAQMMGGAATSSPQFTPQMAANFGAGGPGSGSSGRQALMAAQQQAQQQQGSAASTASNASQSRSFGHIGITSAGTSPSAPGSFQQQQQGGPFGPMSTGQPGSQAGFNNPGSRFGGGASSNIPAGSFGNLGMGGSNSSGNGMFANPGLGLNPARSEGELSAFTSMQKRLSDTTLQTHPTPHQIPQRSLGAATSSTPQTNQPCTNNECCDMGPFSFSSKK